MLIHTTTTARPEIDTSARYTVSGASTLLSSDAKAPAMLSMMALTGVPRGDRRAKHLGIWPWSLSVHSIREAA
ncbi:hypothetical protein D3C81_832430 [compost metagenome]